MSERGEPEKIVDLDSEYLSGKRQPYQEDIALVEDVDRYSNSFIRIYFPIPAGRENEIARKVLIKHLQSGNSYGIQLKDKHTKFPQPDLGPWVEEPKTVGAEYKPSVLEGWEPPAH